MSYLNQITENERQLNSMRLIIAKRQTSTKLLIPVCFTISLSAVPIKTA